MQSALALLVRREHSQKDLARKLSARGIAEHEISETIERLAGDGWQSDARFGEMLVRTRVAHGYGPIRIRAELGTHGLDGEAVQAAMATFDGDWLALASDLLARRLSSGRAQDLAQRRKAADFLYRRGFDGDMVRAAMKAVSGD